MLSTLENAIQMLSIIAIITLTNLEKGLNMPPNGHVDFTLGSLLNRALLALSEEENSSKW